MIIKNYPSIYQFFKDHGLIENSDNNYRYLMDSNIFQWISDNFNSFIRIIEGTCIGDIVKIDLKTSFVEIDERYTSKVHKMDFIIMKNKEFGCYRFECNHSNYIQARSGIRKLNSIIEVINHKGKERVRNMLKTEYNLILPDSEFDKLFGKIIHLQRKFSLEELLQDDNYIPYSIKRSVKSVEDLFSKSPRIRFSNTEYNEHEIINEISLEYPICAKYASKDILRPYLKEFCNYSLSLIEKNEIFKKKGIPIGYFEIRIIKLLQDAVLLLSFGIKKSILELLEEQEEGE